MPTKGLNTGSDPGVTTWNLTFHLHDGGPCAELSTLYLNGAELGRIEKIGEVFRVWPAGTYLQDAYDDYGGLAQAVGALIGLRLGEQ